MYNRMTKSHDCDRLSHLIYRLHRSLDYKNKFLLVTRIFEFKNELPKSEDLSLRLLTSVDPEFIYLLLRSSTIFKIIGLEISNLLMCNKKNAKHMRKLLVYVSEILETNVSRKDFVYDVSTKAISEYMGEYDIVWMRLIYQSLTCLERLSEYLGLDYIYSNFTYIGELNESVEYLLNDMFDVSLHTEDGLGGSGLSSVSTKSGDFNDFSCELCEFLKKNEFKDEAMKLEELYKDLDSLAKAHLEELDMEEVEANNDSEYETETEEDNNNKEEKEEENKKQNENKENKNKRNEDKEKQKETKENLLSVLERLGDAFLEELKEKNKDVCLYLSCVVILFKILPGENKVKFVRKCLDSNNFDVIKSLLTKIQSFSNAEKYDKQDLEGLNELMYKYCVGVLDSNMTRENVVFLLEFVKEYMEDMDFSGDKQNYNYLDLLKVAKRCEIEIYLSLEEVFRKEEVVSSSIPFETMEVVMSVIADVEDPFENMDEFFSIFHRTIQLLFDYFDHLYENKEKEKNNKKKKEENENENKTQNETKVKKEENNNKEDREQNKEKGNKNIDSSYQVNKYKTCVVRLLSCWMTLESMHFQSKYLQKLPRILAVIDEIDFIWLLPTFSYIEGSDLFSTELFLEKLVRVVYEVSKFDYEGEVARNTIRMSCELLQRLHLDPLVDYKRMLRTFVCDSKVSSSSSSVSSSFSCSNSSTSCSGSNDYYKELKLVDYQKYFEEKLDLSLFEEWNEKLSGGTFTPKWPLEHLMPICVDLDESNAESYKVMSSVALELLFKMCKKSEIRFVKEFLEGKFDLKVFIEDLENKNKEKYNKEEKEEINQEEEFNLLSDVTLATVSSCMARVYESSFVKNYGNGLMAYLLSLTVYFFLHMSPRSSLEYLYEENELESFYSFCRLSVLLMQNYPLFVKLFNYSVKKVGLRIASPAKEDFEKIVEEGLANEEDLVLSQFFSMYTYSL